MEKIERCCNNDNINFDADGNRVRCFPHIINISAQTIAQELKDAPHMVTATLSMADDGREERELYQAALEANPIGKARAIVAAMRASGQRREDLREVIDQGNKDGCWAEVIPLVQLLRDVETRWSSLLAMIKCVIELYPAIMVLLDKTKYSTLGWLQFTAEEYQVLNDIVTVLEQPHFVQELLSAEKTPTLSLALPAFELLLINWTVIQSTIPELAHYIGVGMHKIREYVEKGRKSQIYALAMSMYIYLSPTSYLIILPLVINPAYKMEWINKYWTRVEASNAKKWMLEAVCYHF
ncbi:hypothetical protein B0H34DRAFT_667783 [Crassisporium funariophilum]|nr:hypothetical protein B0H34DRAFT_667783 [Crassisporium funariophilum]